MPTLPTRPSLEHLKKQAKRLHKAVKSSDSDAIALLTLVIPRNFLCNRYSLSLHGATFSSWTKLKHHVEADITGSVADKWQAQAF